MMGALSLTTRCALSLFLAGVLGVIGIGIAWLTFSYFVFTQNTYALTSNFAIGGCAALGAAIAWWNTESSPWEQRVDTALIIVVVLASAWVGYGIAAWKGPEIVFMTRGTTAGYVGVWNSLSVTAHVYFGAVFGAIVPAGAVYLRRALPRREL